MGPLLIILIIIGSFILLSAIAGIICYHKLAVPNRKPLSEDEVKICKEIIRSGKAYPFMCRQAVKLGMCPCLPCEKLNKAKSGIPK